MRKRHSDRAEAMNTSEWAWQGHIPGWPGYERGLDVRILAGRSVVFRVTGKRRWKKADSYLTFEAYEMAFWEGRTCQSEFANEDGTWVCGRLGPHDEHGGGHGPRWP